MAYSKFQLKLPKYAKKEKWILRVLYKNNFQ
jgi:hypothetical protein